MTATDQLTNIASLEKELAAASEKLKVKRLVRDEALCRITDLRDEQGRLRHQISRLQAQQELAKRLDNLTQQIEAKKKQKALLLSRIQSSELLSQKSWVKGDKQIDDEATENHSDTSFHSNYDLGQFLESESDKEAQTNGNDSGSYFSIPETRSVYEGFEFRDRELRSSGGASQSQSQLSTESSASGANNSYRLPYYYSPAVCRSKGIIQQRGQPIISSKYSTALPCAPTERPSKHSRKKISSTKHHAKEVKDQDVVAPITSSNALTKSPIVPQLVRQSSVSPAKRSSSTTGSMTSASVDSSAISLYSISSTFSPPLVWEHSTTLAPKSPGDFLLAKNSNVQLPSMLDAMLERRLHL